MIQYVDMKIICSHLTPWIGSPDISWLLIICIFFFFNIYLFIWQRPVLAGACMIFVATFQLLVVVCGVQFPDQGLNPGLLYWEQGVLTTALLRSTPPPFFFNWLIYLAMAYLSLHLLKNMHHRWAQPSKKYLLQFILNIWLTFLKLRLVCVFC